MSDILSTSVGTTPQGITLNQTRRMYNFGDTIAEINPQQSLFFSYLSKMGKKATDDPIFKQLEKRHQWQRRTFFLGEAVSSDTYTAGTTLLNTDLVLTYCHNDQYGIDTDTTEHEPMFFVKNMNVVVADTTGTPRQFMVTTTPSSTGIAGTVDVAMVAMFGATCAFADDAKGMVIGSAWEEAGTDPDGWKDMLYTRDGYCQIFKTAISLFSNTARATRYRGDANEYKRVWMEKLMEHKMDIERAMLFGNGSSGVTYGSDVFRLTHGIVPYTEANGKTYNFTYANSKYDDFVDAMEDFFKPETGNSGNKLVIASRPIISYFSKLGEGTSLLGNTVGKSQYKLNITEEVGVFGNKVTKVETVFGNLFFVPNHQLTSVYEDYAIAIDMNNVKYRPLVGNGINRDTSIETNIQNNNVDGRKDQILTEAGLQIDLPETHAVLKWA